MKISTSKLLAILLLGVQVAYGATNFPSAVDDDSSLGVAIPHQPVQSAHHNNVKDAVEAIEQKIGVNGTGASSTLDYLLKNPLSVDPGHKHTAASITFGLTTGSIAFGGAGGVIAQDNANFFWNATLHRLGIGTTAPTANLEVDGSVGDTFINGQSVNARRYGTGGSLIASTTSGTKGSPLAVLVNTTLGTVDFQGLNQNAGSAFIPGARVTGQATETWSTGANGAQMLFATIPNGTTTLLNRMSVNNNGDVVVSSASIAGTRILKVGNTDNTNLASHAELQIQVGGSAAGDPKIDFNIPGGTILDWSIGTDHSDLSKFKISRNASLGTNDAFVIDGSNQIAIGNSTPVSLFNVGTANQLQITSTGTLRTSGLVDGFMRDRGGQVYNVMAAPYSAVPDGVALTGAGTDNTLFIQAAINDAGNAGGGEILIPAGRFKVTFSQIHNSVALVLNKSNLTLRCEPGGVLQIDMSAARAAAACHSVASPQKAVIAVGDNESMTSISNIKIKDCIIDGLTENPATDDFEWCNGIGFSPGFGGVVSQVEISGNTLLNIGGDDVAECRSSPGQCALTASPDTGHTSQQCGPGFAACPVGEFCSNRGLTQDVNVHDNTIKESIGQALGIGGGTVSGVNLCPMKHVKFNNNIIRDASDIAYLTGLGPEAIIASPGVEDIEVNNNQFYNWGDLKFDGVPTVHCIGNTVDFTPQSGSTPQNAIMVDTSAGSPTVLPNDVIVSDNWIDAHTFGATNEGNLSAIRLIGSARRFIVHHNIVRMPTARANTGIGVTADATSSPADVPTEVIVDDNIVWDSSCTGGHSTCAGIDVSLPTSFSPQRQCTVHNNQLYTRGECMSVAGGTSNAGFPWILNVHDNYCSNGNVGIFNADGATIHHNTINHLEAGVLSTNTPNTQTLVCQDCNNSIIDHNTVNTIANQSAAGINIRQTITGRGNDNVVDHNIVKHHTTSGSPLHLNEQGVPLRTLWDTNTLLGDTPVLGFTATTSGAIACDNEIVLARFNPVENATTYYNMASPAAAGDATEANVNDFRLAAPEVAHTLRVLVGTTVAVGSWVVTLRDNAAATSVTCTISSGTTCQDRVHIPGLFPLDLLDLQVVGSATVTAATDMRISLCLSSGAFPTTTSTSTTTTSTSTTSTT